MTKMQNNARAVALEALNQIDQGSYSNLELNKTIADHEFKNDADRRLVTELVYGVLQHKLTLDFYLQPFLKKPSKVKPWVINLLRMSIYQFEYLDRIPEWAILNETIEIAKQKGHDGIRRLVTGVLRSYQREGHQSLDIIQDLTDRLSVQYSVEIWIVKALLDELGEEHTKSILESINQPSKLDVRMNLLKFGRENIVQALEDDGFEVEPSQVAAEGLVVSGGHDLSHSRAFDLGMITIQDESAMLVAEAMQLKSGEQVLDVCSAPGGKTTQIAQYVGDTGSVTALDIYEKRVALVKRNAKRMRLNRIVDTHVYDATKITESDFYGKFDHILVDAPCSGIGLLRRKPEIRYSKEISDTVSLQKLQLEILNAAADLVEDKGLLTYSTCTILKTENQETIKKFLEDHSDFELEKVTTKLKIKDDRESLDLNIYPDDFESDGFYIANLRKVR